MIITYSQKYQWHHYGMHYGSADMVKFMKKNKELIEDSIITYKMIRLPENAARLKPAKQRM